MTYALLILEQRGDRQARNEAQGRDLYERMERFSADLKARGLLTMSQSLASDTAAVRIRSKAGKTTVVDGPFAEAKEMIGGFFLLTCKTREEAMAIAKECPATQWATVEVRELGPCFAESAA